ncbi:MAG: DEAD/DEAH box helicase family protein, partial [Chloroflexota bacterium]
DLSLESYDRFFPSQDTLPKGGFGNLIALPLQPLSRLHGHTEFVDTSLCPWSDQWDFLSKVQRLSATHVASLGATVTPLRVGPGSATVVAPPNCDTPALPATITGTLSATLVVHKTGLPAWFVSQLRHLASLHNPVFYERQKLRLSTYRTPRFIRCYEEDPGSLVLPRGVLEEVRSAVTTAGSKLAIQDLRPHPAKQTFLFTGTLTPIQQAAIRPFLHHEYGVLVAPPGAGKTVMACAIAAQRSVPTLILVHRKPLMEQWRMQIASLLGIARADIGEISGTTHRRTGMIDLAMVQSLRNLSEDETLYREYGLLIVDECHHVPAFNFESIMKRVAVQAVLGLTATPYRRDGLQDLIVMQCGPVRHKISSRSTAASGELTLEVLVRNTGLTRPANRDESIQDVFHALGQDDARLRLVTEDVVRAVRENRRCLVLSERKEHCRLLSEHLAAKGILPLVVDGSVKKSIREAILDDVRTLPPEKEFVLIATGQYLGEGFDCPQADTLFLTFPISFKGKLIQYLGRIMRPYLGKTVAHVYDYADVSVPVLKQMHLRRLKTYAVLGA